MICEPCHGTGRIFKRARRPRNGIRPVEDWPCSSCNGTGFDHCCDGLRAQPESAQREDEG